MKKKSKGLKKTHGLQPIDYSKARRYTPPSKEYLEHVRRVFVDGAEEEWTWEVLKQ